MHAQDILGTILLVVGAIIAVSEMHTLTIYLIAIALACFAGAVVAFYGGGLTATLVVIGIVILLGMPLAHWVRGRMKNRASDEVSQDDVGRPVTVIEAGVDGALRVYYRGTDWNARLMHRNETIPQPGQTFSIITREGSTLVIGTPAASD
jgi:membrane protein implicated in regulation of membrane protease activity